MIKNDMESDIMDNSEGSLIKEIESEKIEDNEIDKDTLEMKNEEDGIYNIGDLVLAKISGYPWWPGMIFSEEVIPKEVKDAKPVSKRRRNGREVRYWLVRFFPAPEYIWASKSDIRPLTLEMIESFLSKKAIKKDIRESYEIAKTRPTVEDLLAQQSFRMKDEMEEEEYEEYEQQDDEEDFNDEDADDQKNEHIDHEGIKRKNMLKRKVDGKKSEAKRRRSESEQSRPKSNNQGKILHDKSRKALNKVTNGRSGSKEGSALSSEQSSQTKWEHKKQQVLFLRHKLQRIMLTTGRVPSEEDMPIVNEQLEKLETFKGIDIAILRTTKIGKVLKRIVQLSDIPSDEKYSIKERSEKLLNFWKDLLEKPNDDVQDNHEGKNTLTPKKDSVELHTVNGDA